MQELLRREDRLVVVAGDAGAGKTTSLRRLALLAVNESLRSSGPAQLPILLTANEITRAGGRLVDTLGAVAARFNTDGTCCFAPEDLHAGRVTVLIDGLDELATQDARQSLMGLLADFHGAYARCRIVLTARGYSLGPDTEGGLPFTRFSISPIKFKQTHKIIERLSRGKTLPEATVQEMLRRLESVHGMELNPLLVTVFVATSDSSRQDIPANITELFKKFTEMMLGRWDLSKGLGQQYQGPLKDFLLCRVAFTMHSRRTISIPLEECRAIMLRELSERGHEADIDALFDEIVCRSGLVRIDGAEARFRHLLLQEFFAGRAAMPTDFLRSVIADPWWRKAVIFHFGERPDHHDDLSAITRSLEGQTPEGLYQAALSVGLAVQACYLTKVTDKTVIMRWVVDSLALTLPELLARKGPAQTPIMSSLLNYLMARDSVGAKVIREVAKAVVAEAAEGAESLRREARLYWCVVGLVEAGLLDEAEDLLKEFHPSDTRLMLSVFLGCVHAKDLRVLPAEQRKTAERLCHKIGPLIEDHCRDMLGELKGMLLEVRSGAVTVLDGPVAKPLGPPALAPESPVRAEGQPAEAPAEEGAIPAASSSPASADAAQG